MLAEDGVMAAAVGVMFTTVRAFHPAVVERAITAAVAAAVAGVMVVKMAATVVLMEAAETAAKTAIHFLAVKVAASVRTDKAENGGKPVLAAAAASVR